MAVFEPGLSLLPMPAMNVAALYRAIGTDLREGAVAAAPTLADAVNIHRLRDKVK